MRYPASMKLRSDIGIEERSKMYSADMERKHFFLYEVFESNAKFLHRSFADDDGLT